MHKNNLLVQFFIHLLKQHKIMPKYKYTFKIGNEVLTSVGYNLWNGAENAGLIIVILFILCQLKILYPSLLVILRTYAVNHKKVL